LLVNERTYISAGTSLLVIGAVLLAMIARRYGAATRRRKITTVEAAWSQ
jgi:hypothetical protein